MLRTVELTNPLTGAKVIVGAGQVILMGVINRSPESANRDVYVDSPREALVLAQRFVSAGVTVIDVGGQSSNYENPEIDVSLELERLLPTIRALAEVGHLVSVDTWKPEVAKRSLEAGAALINDTGGLQDERMVGVVADASVPAILMHIEGTRPLEVGSYESRSGQPGRIAEWMNERVANLGQRG
ncbi:MAG TPA: hypothetical protein ENH15_05485, partial [Actinobacteria bacterium]|nr:hypothetical protein [Actinomycetota bacterium]